MNFYHSLTWKHPVLLKTMQHFVSINVCVCVLLCVCESICSIFFFQHILELDYNTCFNCLACTHATWLQHTTTTCENVFNSCFRGSACVHVCFSMFNILHFHRFCKLIFYFCTCFVCVFKSIDAKIYKIKKTHESFTPFTSSRKFS